MKNTKNKGIVHFRIFKWSGKYIGIAKELGFVEESPTFDGVKNKLLNGTKALVIAVRNSSENLEGSLNMKPPLKYLICYYIAPIIGLIEFLKNGSSTIYSFTTSLRNLQHA